MKLSHQKQLFDVPEEITYLNIASLSPSFKSSEKAGINAIKEKSQPHVIPTSRYFEPVIELKKLFASIIDVDDYNRIACIPSASYGMASVAKNITLQPGDEIILIESQFPSNYYIWEKLAQQYNAVIKTIAQPKNTTEKGKLWNESIVAAITDKTALVAMGNIHWTNGTLFDLKAIRKKTKEHNSLLVIDGSQSIGALPFSVKDIQPDALVCAGYKWLFGPYGCAYAYFGSYFDNGNPIEENWINRLDSDNMSQLTSYQSQYKPLANRYSAGEHPSFIYVQMQLAALKELQQFNPKLIQDYCAEISSESILKLKEARCTIEDDSYRAKHLFGVLLPEKTNIDQLKERLANEQVFVSFRGNYIRVSAHLYNTKSDFEKLTQCVLEEL